MTGCKLYLYIIGAAGERVKIMWYCAICLVRTPDQCDDINRLFSARGAFYLTAVITSERLITPDCTLQRLGQLYDHTFCPSMISSGAFMRNWAMCKKVLAESHFFLKHGWIHFLGFLLIPRYNHDRIIREFRRPRRRTGILCFVMEGYALIAVRR